MVREFPEYKASVGFQHVYNEYNYTAVLFSCVWQLNGTTADVWQLNNLLHCLRSALRERDVSICISP
jgi:hypothetical protein